MYYLIKENNTLLITSNTEDFGGDTSAVLIASSRSIKKLSKQAFSGLHDKINQLSEQLQQLNFSK